MARSGRAAAVVAATASLAAAFAPQGPNCGLRRIGQDPWSTGVQLPTQGPALSSDGRFVVFSSFAPLVPQDSGVQSDVYLLDRATGALELVSIGAGGGGGNLDSPFAPFGIRVVLDVSDDGRRVAWVSAATDLAPNAGYLGLKAFVWDRATGQTQLVCMSPTQPQGLANTIAISGDGRFVAFATEVPLLPASAPFGEVYVKDLQTGAIESVGVAWNGQPSAFGPSSISAVSLSADGRYVTFESRADDHVVSGTVGQHFQVYRRDRLLALTELVSVDALGNPGDAGTQDARLSNDGRYVVFGGSAMNLTAQQSPWQDVFVRDMVAGTTECSTADATAGPAGQGHSFTPAISPEGRYVTFASHASGLVPGGASLFSDVYLHDRTLGTTRRLSIATDGMTDGHSNGPALSQDAALVAFDSHATKLVEHDRNDRRDLFLWDCLGPVESYCVAKTNSLGCVPEITWVGIPSASWTQGFELRASPVRNQSLGQLFYGLSGADQRPFHGATLCVRPPLRRTALQSSGGSPFAPDCSGTYRFDFLAWTASGADPALVAGRDVWAQFWSRDAGFPAPQNFGLTDAATFVLLP